MKLAKLAHLLAIAALLSQTVIGCKKGLDKTTHIPKGANPTVGDGTTAGIRDPNLNSGTGLNPNRTDGTGLNSTTVPPSDTTTSDIPAGPGHVGWDQNPDEFKAQTIYFDYDKSNIKPSEIGKLEEVAKRMKSSFPGKALLVEGHCDERGTEEYNRALGDKRAQSGREKLVHLGLEANAVDTISFGEEKPADTGHDEAAWKKNRRIQFILLSPPGAAK